MIEIELLDWNFI